MNNKLQILIPDVDVCWRNFTKAVIQVHLIVIVIPIDIFTEPRYKMTPR